MLALQDPTCLAILLPIRPPCSFCKISPCPVLQSPPSFVPNPPTAPILQSSHHTCFARSGCLPSCNPPLHSCTILPLCQLLIRPPRSFCKISLPPILQHLHPSLHAQFSHCTCLASTPPLVLHFPAAPSCSFCNIPLPPVLQYLHHPSLRSKPLTAPTLQDSRLSSHIPSLLQFLSSPTSFSSSL